MNCSDRVGTGVSRACSERSRRVQAERSSIAARSIPLAVATVIIATIISSITSRATSQTSPAWRYDLRPGDHLIYRYSFHRQTESSNNDEQSHVDLRFRTHVL